MNRRIFLTASTLAAFLALGCGSEKPRALVVADGSGPVHARAVDTRARLYEKRAGRPVRILQVEPAQAVTLASRGEADVAVVPTDTDLATFLASEHGHVHGLLVDGGERLRILEVNAKQHPKVDAKGAKELSTALITPP